MAAPIERKGAKGLHPLHAILLASTFPLFLGGLLSDIAYGKTYEIQWSNFAAWLNAGALLFAGPALLWSLVDLFRSRRGRPLLYFLLLLGVFVIGLINAFVHAKDAWAKMPEGLVLSAITLVLAVAALWAGFSSLRARDVK